jgi:hypothetical protein
MSRERRESQERRRRHNEGVDHAMGVVLKEVKARELHPIVLIAFKKNEIKIMPCGPGKMDGIYDLLRAVVKKIDAQDVVDEPYVSVPPEGHHETN